MLAVPLHGDDVAPRFCSAEQFAIAKLDAGRAHRICRLTIRDEAWPKRLEHLAVAGVSVLLCGGFNGSFLPHAEALGIRVISGFAGEAERLIDAFARGSVEQSRFLPCRKGSTVAHGGGAAPPEPSTGALTTNRGKAMEPRRISTEPACPGPDRARGEVWVAAAGRPTERQKWKTRTRTTASGGLADPGAAAVAAARGVVDRSAVGASG